MMISRSSPVPEEVVEAAAATAEKRVNAMAVYFIVLDERVRQYCEVGKTYSVRRFKVGKTV